MTEQGRGRWALIGSTEWTLVVRPGAGWWPRAVVRYAGAGPVRLSVALLVALIAQVKYSVAVPRSTAFDVGAGAVIQVGFCAFNFLTAAVVNGWGWAPSAIARLSGGRLVEPVELQNTIDLAHLAADRRHVRVAVIYGDLHHRGERRVFVSSALAADNAVDRDAALAGVTHELLWQAGRIATSNLNSWSCVRHGRDADKADQSWRAWAQFTRRVMAPRVGGLR